MKIRKEQIIGIIAEALRKQGERGSITSIEDVDGCGTFYVCVDGAPYSYFDLNSKRFFEPYDLVFESGEYMEDFI